MGQRTQLFYQASPWGFGRAVYGGPVLRAARGRFLFDFVHEEKLALDDLQKYSALLLPNIALLSDSQLRQLRRICRGRRFAAGDL